jgi:hypothetical protein
MNELIDESLNKIIALSLEEFEKFEPVTVADRLALVLVTDAFDDEGGGVRAIQLIADRAGGRAVAKTKSAAVNTLAADLMKMLNPDG